MVVKVWSKRNAENTVGQENSILLKSLKNLLFSKDLLFFNTVGDFQRICCFSSSVFSSLLAAWVQIRLLPGPLSTSRLRRRRTTRPWYQRTQNEGRFHHFFKYASNMFQHVRTLLLTFQMQCFKHISTCCDIHSGTTFSCSAEALWCCSGQQKVLLQPSRLQEDRHTEMDASKPSSD